MEISPRKSSKQVIDPADEWLKNEGYYRKSSAKDPTCLFRAVSEQIYMTQYYHIRVRNECIEFMRENKDLFEESIGVPMDHYLQQLQCFTEWGGINEIEAMSRLYKHDFIVFYCQNMMNKNVTNNGFNRLIYLCHTPPQQYDPIYDKHFITSAAFCQSIVYKTLYKDVFGMLDIDDTIQNMLHDRPSLNIRHNKFFLRGNISSRERLTTELLNKYDNGADENNDFSKNTTPFPYRVAKALDPNIFRNTNLDIWHELKREARNGGWTRWNNSELQVGGKCLVQMDVKKKDELDDSNNNSRNILNRKNTDKKSNLTENNTNNNKTMKKESPLFIGHIQEMSKDEGPVLVFIEELGEKKTVPYSSLKPLHEQQKLRCSTMVHRKNSPFDHAVVRWKKPWNSNIRKTKDNVSSAVFTMSLNGIDNNRSRNDTSRDNKKNTSNKNTNGSEGSSVTADSVLLNNYTSIKNFSPSHKFTMDNTVEVRPLSIVLDNSQPLVNSLVDPKNNFRKDAPIPINNKNSIGSFDKSMNNNNNNNNINNPTTESTHVVQLPQQATLPTTSEMFYPTHSSGPPPPPPPPPSTIYSGNLNVVCVSPDGNVYAPMSFFGGNLGEPSQQSLQPPPPANVVDRANQIVNLAIQTSVDLSGNDLPYTDIPTLRFFFNLGVECFHNNHLWTSNNSPPMGFAPSFVPQSTAFLSLSPPDASHTNENIQQSPNSLPSNSDGSLSGHSSGNPSGKPSRPHQPQTRRKNEQPFNFNRTNAHAYGNSKFSASRNDIHQDSVKNKTETSHSSYDQQKNRPSYSNENQRDYSNNNWESRKNHSQGRFRRNNEGRNRNDRTAHYHNEYPQRSFSNQVNNSNTNAINNDNNNFGKSESRNFQKFQSEIGNQTQPMNPPPAQTPIPASSPPYHQHMNHPSATMYTNVPYFASEPESFFPPNTNMYPVPYIPHSETADGGNNPNHYVCAGPESFPPSTSPMYAPMPYPPPPLYPTVSGLNPPENWYTIHSSQPHYIQYSQLPISHQSPPPQHPAVHAVTPSNN